MIGRVLSFDEDRPPVPPADLMLRVVPSFDGGDVESARHAFDLEGLTIFASSSMRLLLSRLGTLVGTFGSGTHVLAAVGRLPISTVCSISAAAVGGCCATLGRWLVRSRSTGRT